MQSTGFDFYLTEKWRGLVLKYGAEVGISWKDALAYSREVEWELALKFPNEPKHIERYFLKVVKHKIKLLGTDWYYHRKVTENLPDLVVSPGIFEDHREFSARLQDRLEQHIVYMLSLINDVLVEMYTKKVTTFAKWKQIRKEYPKMGDHQFNDNVRTIKDIVIFCVRAFKKNNWKRIIIKENQWIVSLLK